MRTRPAPANDPVIPRDLGRTGPEESAVPASPPRSTAVRARQRVAVALHVAFALLVPAAAPAQSPAPPPPEPGISDNSFLIEEAYNQERGVVQHISSFARDWESGDWLYTFTQEWPVPGERHQLSFTLPVLRVTLEDGTATGLGDALLNYRLQVAGMGEDPRVAFAPRLSVLLPTGSDARGLGAGGAAVQLDLPLSVTLGSRLVTHWNAGVTHAPKARDRTGEEAPTTAWNLGQSVVWLAHPRFNVLLETVWVRAQIVEGPGTTRRSDTLLLNPGIRWAWNFRNGLQIVPGLSMPIGLGPSRGYSALFLYLSFEHPFRRTTG
jgi:hypothetical protein